MIAEFNALNDAEIELMLKAPVLACILIAGADNDIDSREIKGAIELAEKRTKKTKGSQLASFYQLVAEDFEDKLKIVLQSYPFDAKRRSSIIADELAQLNLILPKLDYNFSLEFYASIKDIALKIAESSGGLLGMKSIGEEEAELVDLSMIKNPTKK